MVLVTETATRMIQPGPEPLALPATDRPGQKQPVRVAHLRPVAAAGSGLGLASHDCCTCRHTVTHQSPYSAGRHPIRSSLTAMERRGGGAAGGRGPAPHSSPAPQSGGV